MRGRQIIIPTGAVPSKITRLVNIPSNHEACLLIGGPTHEYPFTELDFIQMIENFVQFSELHKFKATVVCSRRTPTLTSKTISYLQRKILNSYALNPQPQFVMYSNVANSYLSPRTVQPCCLNQFKLVES